MYLDNFLSGESSSNPIKDQGLCLQLDAMQAWTEAGILTAKDKQVLNETEVVELGVRFDGINGLNLGFTSHHEQRKVEQERSPRLFLAAGSLSYNSGVRPWVVC